MVVFFPLLSPLFSPSPSSFESFIYIISYLKSLPFISSVLLVTVLEGKGVISGEEKSIKVKRPWWKKVTEGSGNEVTAAAAVDVATAGTDILLPGNSYVDEVSFFFLFFQQPNNKVVCACEC